MASDLRITAGFTPANYLRKLVMDGFAAQKRSIRREVRFREVGVKLSAVLTPGDYQKVLDAAVQAYINTQDELVALESAYFAYIAGAI